VKIAFTLAFRELVHPTGDGSWKDAIEATLLKGGDTDTNACIVGGLVGASVGMSKLCVLSIGL